MASREEMAQLAQRLETLEQQNQLLQNAVAEARQHAADEATAASAAATRAAAAAALASPATASAGTESKKRLSDTPVIKQPDRFDGSNEAWSDLSFQFRMYVASLDMRTIELVKKASTQTGPAGSPIFPEDLDRSQSLFFLFLMIKSKASKKI